ncbi:MAG TPA: hypothetical protein VFW66_15540 [Gemmatimonadales bacterium]|nr:hypothetical protein [Gemmatimonadales bacterium]
MRAIAGLGAALAILSGAAPAPSHPRPPYHLLRRVVLGGEGWWDYVTMDPVRRRLFIAHATQVLVVDADRGTVIGRIPDTPGVHGTALAQALGRGFISDGADSTVTIFNLRTLRVLSRVRVTGRNPDAIVYEPVTRRVFTMNGGSDNATAIDAATGAVVGTIALGGRPEFAVADGRGRVYVNLEDRSELTSFDARTLAAAAPWSLAPCEEPSGLAIDTARRRLFSGCANQLMAVTDADQGRVLDTVPIGAHVDANAFDAATGLAFSSNGDGTLTVVDARGPHPRVAQTVTTARGARTMALDPRTHRVYLVTAAFGPPPAPTPEHPHPRPSVVPGTFELLVVGR